MRGEEKDFFWLDPVRFVILAFFVYFSNFFVWMFFKFYFLTYKY